MGGGRVILVYQLASKGDGGALKCNRKALSGDEEVLEDDREVLKGP